jgi:ATP phosphoribosyltransferase
MTYSGITLALSKGRIFEETLPLLAAAGIAPSENPESSRKLIIGTNRADVRLIIVRASDVPTYVQYGAADLGIAGKDVLNEHGGNGLYQPLDLRIARCSMMVAVREGYDYAGNVKQGARIRVATKYVNAARDHFASKGVHIDLIKLYGSMELAPLVGLSDVIVDLVSTRRHPQGQRPGRGGTHQRHQFAPGGESGCAQAQARVDPARDRWLLVGGRRTRRCVTAFV